MKLFDIGNSRVHLYDDGNISHFLADSYRFEDIEERVFYISVNAKISKRLEPLTNWINLQSFITPFYSTIGVDRQFACMAESDAVIIDAGSAITVDVMQEGEYIGGYILPGVNAMQSCYADISKALDSSFNFELSLDKMATNTRDSITFGYLGTFALHVNSLGKQIILTGGDAEKLQPLFEKATIDYELVFRGMKKIIDEGKIC